MKVDYLTISLLPGQSGATKQEAVDRLLKAMLIEEWQTLFEVCGSDYNYEIIMRYANVSLKIPRDKKYKRNGICLEFSGSGIDYYQNYLRQSKATDLRTVCSRFLLLYKFGYKTKSSRFDVAQDDKCFGDDKPLLVIDDIEKLLKDRAFVTKFRRSEPDVESGELVSAFKVEPNEIDDKLTYEKIESMNLSTGRLGKTIYLGKRKSASYIRIYDKLAEQEVKGGELPPDLKHWVRFEVEFKKNNASSVFYHFCNSKNDKEFSAYMSRCFFDLIRFVDMDHSRRYNCTVCSWWLKFLGNMADKGITVNKLSQNQYLKSRRYLIEQMCAIIYALSECDPDVFYETYNRGQHKVSKTKMRILSDFKAYQSLAPPEQLRELENVNHVMTGEEYWRLFTGDQSDREFDRQMFHLQLKVYNSKVGKSSSEFTPQTKPLSSPIG